MARLIAALVLMLGAALAIPAPSARAEDRGIETAYVATLAVYDAGVGTWLVSSPYRGFWHDRWELAEPGAILLAVGVAAAVGTLDSALAWGHPDRAAILAVGNGIGMACEVAAALVYLMESLSDGGCDETCSKLLLGAPLLASAAVSLIVAIVHWAVVGDAPPTSTTRPTTALLTF